MKVQLEKTFPVPAGADTAWDFLQRLEAVAQCMPGATITERIDDRHFKGTVNVRVGPVSLSFRGQIEIEQLDPATRTLRLLAKSTDSTGTSGASMDLTARIEAAGSDSRLVGASEVSMSGKAAAFGARALGAVADQVLKQFGERFAAQASSPGALAQSGAPDAAGEAPSGRAPAGAASQPLPAESASPRARELDGLALLWAASKDWLRKRIGKGPA